MVRNFDYCNTNVVITEHLQTLLTTTVHHHTCVIFTLHEQYLIDQRFTTWGTCTPRGTFAYQKGYI